MANQERVVLVAEVRDEATGPLGDINKAAEDTGKKIDSVGRTSEKSAGKANTAFDRFSKGGSKAFQRFSGNMRGHLQKGVGALGDLGQRIHDSDGMFGRFVRGGTRGLQNLAAGFKSPQAAASSFTGKLGSIGGVVSKGVGALGGIGRALAPAVSVAGNVLSGIGNIAGKAISAGAAIVSNIASTLADAAKKAGAVAGILGGLVIGEGLRGGISRAMNIEDAEARMRGMGYAANDIDELMDNASDAIMGTAFRLDDAATAAAQFSASGVSAGEDMERVIGLVGDSAFAAGTDFNQMGEIWAQVSARGTLDGQTMNRLLSAGVGITGELAEHFGVAEDEVQNLVSSGSVSFEDFAEVMEVKVGGAAQEMAETTRGALMNVQAGLHMVGAEVAGPFMQLFRGAFNSMQEPLFAVAGLVTPIFEVLTERAQEWADTAYGAGESAAESINALVEPVEKVADLMRDGMPMFEAFSEVFDFAVDTGITGFLTNIGDFISEFSPLIGAAAGGVLALATQFGRFIPIIGRFLPVFNPILGIIVGLIAGSSELRAALGDAFTAIGDALMEIGPIFGEALGEIGTALAPLVGILVGGLADAITSLVPVFVEFLGMIGDLVAGVAPLLTDLATLAVDLFLALGDVLAPVMGDIMDTIMGLVPVILELATTLISSLMPVLPVIAGVFFSVLEAVLPLVPVILDLAMGLLDALLPAVPPLVDAVLSLLTALLPLLPMLVTLAVSILTPLIGVVGWLAEILAGALAWTIEHIVVPIVEFLAEHLGTLIGWLAGLGDESTEQGAVVSDAFEWIGETAEWLWDNILEPFFKWAGEEWERLGDTWDEVYDEYIEPVISGLGTMFTWLWEDVLQPAFSWITENWDNLGAAFDYVYDEYIAPPIRLFGSAVSFLWEDILAPTFGWIGERWEWLSGIFSSVWEDGIKPILTAFGEFFTETIPGWVNTGVGMVESAWESVKSAFATPINWVIDVVWNNGIRSAFNAVAGLIPGISEMDKVSLIGEGGSSGSGRGNLPGYAKGGVMGDGWKLVGEEGPELIRTGPGWVATASETKQLLGSDSGLGIGGGDEEGNWFTRGARRAGGAIADGARWAGGAVADGARWVGDQAAAALDWARGSLANTAETLISLATAEVRDDLSNYKGMGRMGIDLIEWGRDKVVDFIRGKDEEDIASGGIDGGEFTANPGGFNRPAQGVISSMAGRRAYAGRFGGMHYGVDIANSIGSTIRAAYDGVVRKIYGSGMDQRMVVGHKGFDTSYLHNSAHLVGVGETVTGGQQIARMGTAGTGPHLHFEVHPGGWYNPSISRVNSLFSGGGGGGRGDIPGYAKGGYAGTGWNLLGEEGPELVDFRTPGRVYDADDTQTMLSPVSAGHSGGGTTTIDRRVTVQSMTINVQADDGEINQDDLDRFREQLQEVLEEANRRGY